MTTSNIASALQELSDLLPGDAISISQNVLAEHASSFGSIHKHSLPSAVLFPRDTADVQRILSIAIKHRIPIIPTGGRTALEGQFLPLPPRSSEETSPSLTGCLSVSMLRMNAILDIDAQSATVRVQAGVKWKDLNSHLAQKGINLFWPVDPGLEATFGGMLAVGGSGTNAVRYGTMRGERVLNLEAVMPDASIIRTRGNSRARKSSLGFDLGKLLVGSEGTLGIITEASLRLEPLLPTLVGISSFPSPAEAISAVVALSQTGLPFQCLEYLDTKCMEAIIKTGLSTDSISYLEKPTIFIKFQTTAFPLPSRTSSSSDGDGPFQNAISIASEIVLAHNGTPLSVGKTEEENEAIWSARKNIFHSYRAIVPTSWGKEWSMYTTDCCVPMSRLSAFIEGIENLVGASDYLSSTIAHAGDGNTHTCIFYRPTHDSYDAVRSLAEAICRLAISLEGTCAGEHGVGLSKKHLMREELGEETVRWMKIVKSAIDPLGIMNPGKMLPD
ncbi:FAD-binding domain-containing protein [Atractiella rhizophila]|nr:FAD-binding domain-containing protein [Atractiella rhizophila]